MTYESQSPEEYISQLPEDRQGAMKQLRDTIKGNLPGGFEETMSYGMITYVVPHHLYAPGYHVNAEQPLPFMSIASQKKYIALYHLGLYMHPELLTWFREEYPMHVESKLDMGKSCIRFKKINNIPYELIAGLSRKISVEEYVVIYERETEKIRNK